MAEAKLSSDKFDSRLLTRRATWSGVVFALAIVLTALNFSPPSEPYYHVRSEVVIAASRLPQLRAMVGKAQGQPEAPEEALKVRLMQLKVLDQSSKLIEGPIPVAQEIALVAMDSLWADRCTVPNYRRWLKAVTRFDESELSSSDIARNNRFANWALATAEHYSQRHEFLASRDPVSSTRDGRSFELVTEPQPRVSLASFAPTSGEQVEPSEGQERMRLQEEVRVRKDELKRSEEAWRQKMEQAHGLLRIASPPRIQVISGRIPVWLLFSIVTLGIFAGCIAGWFHHRLQSGGAYDPWSVADQLALQGLPVAGAVTVTDPEYVESDWLERSGRLIGICGRKVARNATRISEAVVGIWFLLAVARLCFDSMWRTALLDSPLAAFSHLIFGLP